MRKLLILSLPLVLFAVLVVAPKTAHASTSDFTIPSFITDYYLTRETDKSSTLEVKESIIADFPSYDQNHGILRAIPKSYQGHTVSLDIESVTNQSGQPYKYTTSSQNGNEILKIGDANTYVHGLMTYNVNYKLRNVINFQKLDEFYWDVNGTEWDQSMNLVSAHLHLPLAIANQYANQNVCYTGVQGSQDKNCTVTRNANTSETVFTISAANLPARNNLSFVIGFKSGTFAQGPEIAAEKRQQLIMWIAGITLTLILPFITFIICFRKWYKEGRDPKGKGVIIPEYVSPKGLNVLQSSFILNQGVAPKASSAAIIEMAVQGYLRINEIEKKKFMGKSTDYEIEVAKDTSGISTEQQLILDALFDGEILPGSKVTISEQKNKLYTTIQKLNKDLSAKLTQAGYFKSDPAKAKKRFTTAAIIMLVIGIFLFILLPLGIGLTLSAFIAFIFSALMPARSPQGVETRDYLRGLKEYISMAEADRIQYLQSPQGVEKTPIDPNDTKQQIKLFEDLLPYAMLFNLEKEWAKQFKDLYIQPPDWYSGNLNTFNALYLANSLSNFSSANAASFTAPSSSGSSGFGGGGFSGGGGGGGGGGGW